MAVRGSMQRFAGLAIGLLCLAWAGRASAQERAGDPVADAVHDDRVATLEARLRTLETQQAAADTAAGVPSWLRRLRLGASADLGYYEGGRGSYFRHGTFDVDDLRLFFDAELGDPIAVADTTVFRNAGFTFEWDVLRLGRLANGSGTRAGELYVELQGFLDSDWLNVQAGRFQLPVSENYLRFSRGQRDNPFASHTVGGPWYWDEGVRLYGRDPWGVFSYVASLTDGETALNFDNDQGKQVTLKLIADPAPWLHVSVSALWSGRLGSPTTAAGASLWLGESFPRAFGSGTGVVNIDHGVAVPDDPDLELAWVWLLGADLVLRRPGWGHLWLAAGDVSIEADGASGYDRRLRYAIAELVVEGALLSAPTEPFYLGLRGHAYGTFDDDEGYLLDLRLGGVLGYNMEHLSACSVVVGWRMTANLRLLVEYTVLRIGLVGGTPAAVRHAAEHADYLAVELTVGF